MRTLSRWGLFLPLLLTLWSCRKPTVASWDSDLVLPVVTSQLNIKNFLGDSIFKADNTGLLHLVATRTVTAIKLDSLIDLPDTTIVNSFTLPCFSPCTFTPGEALPLVPSSELTFSIGNSVALKRTDIRSGYLKVRFTNDTRQPIDLIYKIPSATKSGQQLIISETIPPFPDSLVKTYDLAGYSLNMTGLSGNKFNTIGQSYTLSISPNATANDTVFFGKGAHLKVSYGDIIPAYLEGYFGQQKILLPLDTARLGILKNFEASNFMLSDARLDFKILNEFGAEFTANLSNIKSINGNSVVSLSTSQLSNLNINSATRANNIVYPSVKTVSLINSNSNIVPFLSNLPEMLTYQGDVSVNPLGNISGYNNFAYYNTGIKVLADIDIPLKFSANSFKLTTETKVDFSNITQLDKVNEGKFVVVASNGYPFTARLQAYMFDEGGAVIDSLFIPGANLIQKGELDLLTNDVKSPTLSRLEIPIDRMKIGNLRQCKTIRLVATLILPSSPPDIHIRDSYVFNVNIIAELNVRVERK